VSETDAPNYIFGYCVGNDFTGARPAIAVVPMDCSARPSTAPARFGPWLVTADQVDGDNSRSNAA